MGQITNPAAPGITVLPIDRQTGPSAGAGNSGNDTLFLGANAGKNNTQPNVIALGNGAASAGFADANLAGSIILGVATIPLMIGSGSPNPGPSVLIGYGNFSSAINIATTIAIGANIAPSLLSPDTHAEFAYSNVMIGNDIATHMIASPNQCVFIGQGAGTQANNGNNYAMGSCVLIGAFAGSNYDGFGAANNIVIGVNAWKNIGNGADNSIVIGTATLETLNGDHQSTYVGGSIGNNGVNGTQGNNAMFGFGIGASGSLNTVIGAEAGNGVAWGQQNIVIGAGAGNAMPAGANYLFDLSTYTNPTIRALLWGNMSNGNLLIGNSRANLDLDGIGCTNGVKIFNGTRGAGNPTGGGFFYVNAGALHWVGSSGTDTTLAVA